MENIVIGKHTLESLTSGMYSDPYVVYREYIQNATDSIDEAFNQGLLNPGEDSINIDINPSERRISIFDNGCGVASNLAVKTLISIGNVRLVNRGIDEKVTCDVCKRRKYGGTYDIQSKRHKEV